jgi:4-diphosphocytidyl-2-C-methyl-D-erythritol kinase
MVIFSPMSGLTVEAPAKINLHLRVKSVRPDGFHEIESLFLALRFGDTLRFNLLDTPLAFEIRGFDRLPPAENIICRAAAFFRAETGFDRGLRVDVDKRIPAGGGLGGGSSDAASTLLALNALSGAALSPSGLADMAARLGSDVPFFLSAGAALVKGRGEVLEALPLPGGFSVALVNPGFPSGTADAFRLLDASHRNLSGALPGPEKGADPDTETLVRALRGAPGDWPFYNAFLPVLDAGTGGIYRHILSRLKELGADFSGLSGAGSTCFGIFTDEKKAEKAVKSLANEQSFTHLTFPLARRVNPVLK